MAFLLQCLQDVRARRGGFDQPAPESQAATPVQRESNCTGVYGLKAGAHSTALNGAATERAETPAVTDGRSFP
jgi:hypothetical protein